MTKLIQKQIDGFIKGYTELLSGINTLEGEKKYPKPKIETIDPTKKKIQELLCENTGCNILDSGGAYGRNWERNRQKDFDAIPEVKVTYNEILGIDVTFPLYPFLVDSLELDEKAQELNKEFDKFEREECQDCSWIETMETFVKKYGYSDIGMIENTYSNEYNYFDQILQYLVFCTEDEDDWVSTYVLLQIHNGCDVRGGYTDPYIFKLSGDEIDLYSSPPFTLSCPKCETYIDLHEGIFEAEFKAYNFEKQTYETKGIDSPDGRNLIGKVIEYEDGKFLCKKCRKEMSILTI